MSIPIDDCDYVEASRGVRIPKELLIELRAGVYVYEESLLALHFLPLELRELAEEAYALISEALQPLLRRKEVVEAEHRATMALLPMYTDICGDAVAERLPCSNAASGRHVDQARATIKKLGPELNRMKGHVQLLALEFSRLCDELKGLGGGRIITGEFHQAKAFYDKLVVINEQEIKLASTAMRLHERLVRFWQAEAKLQHLNIAHLCSSAEKRPDKAIVAFRLHLAQRYTGLAELNCKLVSDIRQMLAAEMELHLVYKKIVQRLSVADRLQAKMGEAQPDVEARLQDVLRKAGGGDDGDEK